MINSTASNRKYAVAVRLDWDVVSPTTQPPAVYTNSTSSSGNWWSPTETSPGVYDYSLPQYAYGNLGYWLGPGSQSLPSAVPTITPTGASDTSGAGLLRAAPSSTGFSTYELTDAASQLSLDVSAPAMVTLAIKGDGASHVVTAKRTADGSTNWTGSVTAPVGSFSYVSVSVNENVTVTFGGGVLLGAFVDPYPTMKSAGYVSYTEPVTLSGFSFAPETRLDVKPGQDHGGTQDKPWYVTMPFDPPMDELAQPYIHSDVFVTIWELDPRDPDGTAELLFGGKITKVTINSVGFKKLVKAEVSGWRYLIQYPMGIQCDSWCAWALGDGMCRVDLKPLQRQVQIASVTNGTLITSATGLPSGSRWQDGSIEIAGAAGIILIVNDPGTNTQFVVDNPPPPTWVGRTAIWTPGCDGSAATCDHYYGNLARFAGFGIAMLDYNPLIGSKK